MQETRAVAGGMQRSAWSLEEANLGPYGLMRYG
jgi:hypothetical protein